MAIVTTDNKHYSNIADAIREKAGKTWEATYKPEDMPSGIAEVYTVGYEKGSNDGFMGGHEAGYEMGKQAEHEEFWSNVLSGTAWDCKFYGPTWNDKTFRPTGDIKPVGSAYSMFYLSLITDLVKTLEDAGVTLDTSGITRRADTMFAWCTNLTTVPYLDLRNANFGTATLAGLFDYCSKLRTVKGLHLSESTTFSITTFGRCSALENLTIYGTIGQNGLYLAYSNNLTHDSLMSVINALADKSGTDTTMTVTLGTGDLAKLTDAEKAMATEKGWTLA